jgi:hypothetical protein
MSEPARVQLFDTMTALAHDEVIIPALRTALFDPRFKGFTVHVPDFEPRPYDGWFHPSSQSTWTVRQLVLYLTHPDAVDYEQLDLKSVLAITQGYFWHLFVQHILMEKKIISATEVPVLDVETNRKGSADGQISEQEGLEIKTITHFKIDKMVSEEVLKAQHLDYWAQAQDYMDCLGWSRMRFLFLNPDYPFKMREFVVKADREHQEQRRRDYRTALALRDAYGQEAYMHTQPCCGPKSKMAQGCPVRRGCPIGMIR